MVLVFLLSLPERRLVTTQDVYESMLGYARMNGRTLMTLREGHGSGRWMAEWTRERGGGEGNKDWNLRRNWGGIYLPGSLRRE